MWLSFKILEINVFIYYFVKASHLEKGGGAMTASKLSKGRREVIEFGNH